MSEINLSNSVAAFDVAKQNEVIKRWTPKVKRRLKNSARIFKHGKKTSFVQRKGRTEGKLVDSIKSRMGKKMGTIELVSFSFERHGVFVHKGVGKGWTLQGGTVVRTATHPTDAPRTPVPWFNNILDSQVPVLANQIAEVNANAALNAVKLHIK
ncbi:MAG: hypothetical protein L3J54_01920 [Draconibacterium sp.]|nr:hypothetical protein [Draconibacterium sp.]